MDNYDNDAGCGRKRDQTSPEQQKAPIQSESLVAAKMKRMNGAIFVRDGQIMVHMVEANSSSTVTYKSATVENLNDAARVLAAGLDLKYEDIGMECRRVASVDQIDASLRELIEDATRRMDG